MVVKYVHSPLCSEVFFNSDGETSQRQWWKNLKWMRWWCVVG